MKGNGVRPVRLTFEREAFSRNCCSQLSGARFQSLGSRAPPLRHELHGPLLSHGWNRRVEIRSSTRRDATVLTCRFAPLLGPTTICQMDRSDPIAPLIWGRTVQGIASDLHRPGRVRGGWADPADPDVGSGAGCSTSVPAGEAGWEVNGNGLSAVVFGAADFRLAGGWEGLLETGR